MDRKKAMTYIRNIVAYTGASAIPMVLNLVANPFIASNMSPEDYAVTGYFTSFNALISPVIIFYLLHYYTKAYFTLDDSGREKLRATIFKALIFFSSAVAAVCFVLIAVYMTIFSDTEQFPVFPYLLMTVFAIPLTGIYTLELTDYKMRRESGAYFRLSAVNGTLLVGMNLLMVVALKLGAFGRLLAPLLVNAIFFTALAIRHRKYFRIRTDFPYFLKIIRFCAPLAASAMLGYFFNGFDKTYLESLGDVREYGIYIVGAQMAGFLTTFATAITSTFQPDMYSAIAVNDNRGFIRTCLAVLALVSGTVVLFIAFAPLIVDILTMGRYTEATPYVRILAISTVTSTIYYAINNYTIARGYPRLYLYTTVTGSAIMMVVLPVMARLFSFMGAAVAVVVSYLILAGINMLFLAGKKK